MSSQERRKQKEQGQSAGGWASYPSGRRIPGRRRIRNPLLGGVWLVWMLGVAGVSHSLPPLESPTPTPTPHATVDFYVMYQDLDGRAGLVPSRDYPSSPTAWTDIRVGHVGNPISYSSTWFSDPDYDPDYSGLPFDFEAEIPGVGVYRGTSYLDVSYEKYLPYFVIPTTSRRLGTEMILKQSRLSAPYPPPNGEYVSVGLSPYLSSGFSDPSYAVPVLAAPTIMRITVTINHLPGSGLEELGRVSKELPLPLASNGTADLAWSGYSYPYPQPNWWIVSDVAPKGPILISVSSDGYSTDTITLDPAEMMNYYWSPVLHPLPNRADVYRPTGLSIYQVLPEWMTVAIDEIVHGILYPAPVDDPNGDGVVDVGDVIAILNQEPYP